MRILDQVITVYEAAELIGGYSASTRRTVNRRCVDGTFTARQDAKGQWLILRSSVIKQEIPSK